MIYFCRGPLLNNVTSLIASDIQSASTPQKFFEHLGLPKITLRRSCFGDSR